ncbi:hypothetical protein CONLIGDRAFT_642687 [Coniochaeta ligniaria NRRL 30616]|uniref:Uncharacterized protein n=1 Tax=Coniochaeta ligniaria NRRL 30616 TaxID=1408157 RepID=A0A1J7ISJ8_9PEZI|nr:hypothetical protein CONLIGDRAFT_642687 [Coniochaeta ligniaria NRRL 30616]
MTMLSIKTILLALCSGSLTSAAFASIKLNAYNDPDNTCSGKRIVTTVARSGVLGSNGCTSISTHPILSVAITGASDINDGVSSCVLCLFADAACRRALEGIGAITELTWPQGCIAPGKDIVAVELNCE